MCFIVLDKIIKPNIFFFFFFFFANIFIGKSPSTYLLKKEYKTKLIT